jgi:2-iminobutanoate/2-iminopropanoate deaminase
LPENHAVTPPPAAACKRAGDTLYLSGQVGVNAQWEPVNESFQEEARQVFRNVAQVLQDAGATLEDIVFVRTYLADFADFAAFNVVWREVFPVDPPARATVQAGLHPPFRVESEVTAYRPSNEGKRTKL